METRAGVAQRADTTAVLDFAFLVYPQGAAWVGRSITTGHVSESAAPQGAVLNLVRAIEAAMEIADQHGLSAREWYDAQQPDEERFARMFVDAVCAEDPRRETEPARGGSVILRTTIVEHRAA